MKKFFYYFTGSVCDTCYKEKAVEFNCKDNVNCNIQISLPTHEKGWQASFAELHYAINHKDFVVTTEVNIMPDGF
jgi:hypothetical protein